MSVPSISQAHVDPDPAWLKILEMTPGISENDRYSQTSCPLSSHASKGRSHKNMEMQRSPNAINASVLFNKRVRQNYPKKKNVQIEEIQQSQGIKTSMSDEKDGSL